MFLLKPDIGEWADATATAVVSARVPLSQSALRMALSRRIAEEAAARSAVDACEDVADALRARVTGMRVEVMGTWEPMVRHRLRRELESTERLLLIANARVTDAMVALTLARGRVATCSAAVDRWAAGDRVSVERFAWQMAGRPTHLRLVRLAPPPRPDRTHETVAAAPASSSAPTTRRGRPPGIGQIQSAEEVVTVYLALWREHGHRPTWVMVAHAMFISERQLWRACQRFGVESRALSLDERAA